MNVGEFKKALRGLKDDTPIRIVTKGVRPYGYGGGELVDVEYASPCYNQEKPSQVWLHIYTNPPTKIIEENTSNKTEEPREDWAEQLKKAEDVEESEREIDKVISKLKAINPEQEVDRQEIAQKIAEMKNKKGHITYPITGLNWSQLDFERERNATDKQDTTLGKKIEFCLEDAMKNEIDPPFSACTGDDCDKRKKCLRYKLFENIQDGNTCIILTQPCKSFIPIAEMNNKKVPREGWVDQIKIKTSLDKMIAEADKGYHQKEYVKFADIKEDKTFEYYMSLPYKMIIYPASEGGYVAEIPDLPGCLTQGDNWQDTFEMIQDAKAAWIDIAMQDGKDIPAPNKS